MTARPPARGARATACRPFGRSCGRLLALTAAACLAAGRPGKGTPAAAPEPAPPRATPEAAPAPNPDGFVTYEPGNLPIILLAPHGGTVAPPDMPAFDDDSRDVGTAELARELAAQLAYRDAAGVARRPYVVIMLLHRRFVEPNVRPPTRPFPPLRKAGEKSAKADPRAMRAYEDFHAFAEHAVRSVQREHGRGLLLDIHALSAKRSVDQYGYLLRTLDLHARGRRQAPATDDALASAVRQRSSMQWAASRKRAAGQVADLVRGPTSLASLVDRACRELFPTLKDPAGKPRGRPATPSERYPNPKAEDTPDYEVTYFNGGYNVWAHSSRRKGVHVDAVQIESTADARNTRAQRKRFAQGLTVALRRFLKVHYDLDISPPQ
ncbi:MAG TPA: hypothetical protein VM695_01940 [Phycisphaerae bacterium]|nr:hypothetical protein [Phycisphaerae bacterium]